MHSSEMQTDTSGAEASSMFNYNYFTNQKQLKR